MPLMCLNKNYKFWQDISLFGQKLWTWLQIMSMIKNSMLDNIFWALGVDWPYMNYMIKIWQFSLYKGIFQKHHLNKFKKKNIV